MKSSEVGIKIQWRVQDQVTQLLRGRAGIQTQAEPTLSVTILDSHPVAPKDHPWA